MSKRKRKQLNAAARLKPPYVGMPHCPQPGTETVDYPGFVVCNDRVSGSITAGRTRLPLWAFISDVVHAGFPAMKDDRDLSGTRLTAEKLSGFLYWLLEQRGDFGRLLCVLADVERRVGDCEEVDDIPWWYRKRMNRRVQRALKKCLEALEEAEKDAI